MTSSFASMLCSDNRVSFDFIATKRVDVQSRRADSGAGLVAHPAHVLQRHRSWRHIEMRRDMLSDLDDTANASNADVSRALCIASRFDGVL